MLLLPDPGTPYNGLDPTTPIADPERPSPDLTKPRHVLVLTTLGKGHLVGPLGRTASPIPVASDGLISWTEAFDAVIKTPDEILREYEDLEPGQVAAAPCRSR